MNAKIKTNIPSLHWQIGTFVLVGLIAFFVDAIVLTFLSMWAGISAILARIPSFLAAVITTWLLNRRYSFRTRAPASFQEFFHYLGAMIIGLSANLVTFIIIVSLSQIAADVPVLALVPATAAGMVSNFVLGRMILLK